MFTKEDYAAYFDQIARVERRMIYGVYDLSRELRDPGLIEILKKIGDDEVRHYGYVLNIFSLIGGTPGFEKRRVSREYCTGVILLRRFQEGAGEEVKAYCVNLSKKGICLECDQTLSPGEVWGLEIRLFDGNGSIIRQGKVVWSKEVEPGLYVNGIEFDT